MGERKRRLLVMAVAPDVFARIPPLLWRESFDVSMPANPRIGKRAVGETAFDLILVGYPLPGLDFQEFLDQVRGFGSPCRQSPVMAVVEPIRLNEATAFVGRGLNRVVSSVEPVLKLERAVADLLEVKPRAAVRLPVDLTTMVKSADRMLKAQTINISASGMLVSDPGSLRAGMDTEFTIEIPGRLHPVRGRARVVRVQKRRPGARQAVGMRFLSCEGNGQELLERYIQQLLEAQQAGDAEADSAE